MVDLSKEELRALLAAAKAHRERDWLLILVAFHHGLRVSEVIAITPDDIRDGHLTVQRLKGSLRTTQALADDPDPLLSERDALIAYASRFPHNQTIFRVTRRQADRIIKRHGLTAKIPAHKLHMHALKHSVAMQTIKTAGIENVRQHLGHKSLSSTGEYLKVSDEAAGASIRAALRTQ